MKRQITAMILIVAVLFVMPCQAYAASAKETVETGVNKVLKTLGDPAFKAKPKDAKIKEVGNIIFDKEKELKKGRVEVQSNIVLSDGRKVPIIYRLTNKSGQWRVYDLIIEGVSLVKNYRTQFREIIAKESPEKLIEILRDKVNKS